MARGAERIDMRQIVPMSDNDPQQGVSMESKAMLLCLCQFSDRLTDDDEVAGWKQHLLQLYIK
jgi:hypothetical protein